MSSYGPANASTGFEKIMGYAGIGNYIFRYRWRVNVDLIQTYTRFFRMSLVVQANSIDMRRLCDRAQNLGHLFLCKGQSAGRVERIIIYGQFGAD